MFTFAQDTNPFMSKRHLVTAALPYANGPLHIGHIAGCYLPADIYVRYLRRRKENVKFICGSDEHGVAITIRAKKEGITPQQVVDRYHGMMRDAFKELGIHFDVYSRTSSDVHKETAQAFFLDLHEKGIFEMKTTSQYYDKEAEQFLADRYIMGTCPVCSHTEAYGDQCENCGSSLSPTELKDPRSMLSGSKPELRDTVNWFLPLDKMAPDIRAYLDQHSDWKPNVYGQCKSWLDSGDGLQARSMTRDMEWGVPVPLEGAEGKVLYVWFDAPLGYISATKELLPNDWEKYWKDKDSRLVHFIGKDNIVFHCIIFPGMLMAQGDYILPDAVPANEFLNLEGQKISTSRNWAVWLHEYLADFPEKQDVLRYALCASAPETKDNDFTWKDFQSRNNSELVAILGNFLNRVYVLIQKNFEGKVPALSVLSETEKEVFDSFHKAPETIGKSIENYRFREALAECMVLARMGNKYLADAEPWKVIKTDEAAAAHILGVAARLAAFIGQCIEPFLPFTSIKILNSFHLSEMQWQDLSSLDWPSFLKEVNIEYPGLLFDKLEDDVIELQLQKLEENKVQKRAEASITIAAAKEAVEFDDFQKMDIRVATILSAERVPKTDKLMKLLVDTGVDQRTVVSGIAEHFSAEELIGKQASILLNLKPRKIKGIESQGMLLFAEDPSGKLHLLSPNSEIPAGSSIG